MLSRDSARPAPWFLGSLQPRRAEEEEQGGLRAGPGPGKEMRASCGEGEGWETSNKSWTAALLLVLDARRAPSGVRGS